jgi:DNA-binding Lrp family transcriptional regulator
MLKIAPQIAHRPDRKDIEILLLNRSERAKRRSQLKDRPMARTLRLDQTDWRILYELQGDGRITNVELARRAGISPPPCLRRVRVLEEQGLITGYRAVLNAEKLGFELTMFAMVGLHSQAEADLVAFEERVRAWPIVRECYMLSGEVDFLLRCVARDLHMAQEFVINELTKAPNVDSVKTTLTLRVSKYDPGVPLSPSGAMTSS